MTVIEYYRNDDMWVQFENGYKVHVEWKDFNIGNVRNPYDRSVHGIGYLGEGEYKALTPEYRCWRGVIARCYDKKTQTEHPTYIGCSTCEEWHCFQNFAKWYDENYYEIDGEKMELDKDILVKGNKVYSPETCLFVPKRINVLFKQKQSRDLPVGITKEWNRFAVNCRDDKERIYLGTYEDVEEASRVYKNYKEKTIKKVAYKYKDKIPKKLFEAIISYEI